MLGWGTLQKYEEFAVKFWDKDIKILVLSSTNILYGVNIHDIKRIIIYKCKKCK